MKHLKEVTIMIALMACLVGCGGKPAHMDDNTYKLGCRALEIMDAYNNVEISKDDAYKELGEIYDRLNSREYDDELSMECLKNDSIGISVLSFQIDMSAGNDLVKAADNLREKLNK